MIKTFKEYFQESKELKVGMVFYSIDKQGYIANKLMMIKNIHHGIITVIFKNRKRIYGQWIIIKYRFFNLTKI